MKVKTSVTLSEDLLRAIDERVGQHRNRSDFIETAVWAFIAQALRAERDRNDLEIINRSAERLNEEAEDVLGYQIAL